MDFFFFVKAADVLKFAIKRFPFGMRFWEDVYFNEMEHIYPPEFRRASPRRTFLKPRSNANKISVENGNKSVRG